MAEFFTGYAKQAVKAIEDPNCVAICNDELKATCFVEIA
jgi:hypothetical protein